MVVPVCVGLAAEKWTSINPVQQAVLPKVVALIRAIEWSSHAASRSWARFSVHGVYGGRDTAGRPAEVVFHVWHMGLRANLDFS